MGLTGIGLINHHQHQLLLSPNVTRIITSQQQPPELFRSGAVRAIPASEAAAAVQTEGFRLLDIRPAWEREKARVKGSVHVPLFVEDTDMSPITLVKKWVHFGYIGAWTGQNLTTINDRFVEEVERVAPDKEEKLLVACGEGLRNFNVTYKLYVGDDGFVSWYDKSALRRLLHRIWKNTSNMKCRILANRQSAARSKERKARYISELEQKVRTLQTEATTLSAQLTLYQRDTTGLTAENAELKIRLQSMEQQAQLCDALNEALKQEVERLKIATGEMVGPSDSYSSLQQQMSYNCFFSFAHQHPNFTQSHSGLSDDQLLDQQQEPLGRSLQGLDISKGSSIVKTENSSVSATESSSTCN